MIDEYNGTGKRTNGSCEVDKNKLVGSSFEIDMNSIVSKDLINAEFNEKLVGHIKSYKFFIVEKHLEASCKITKAAPITNAKAGENNDILTSD